MVSASFPRSAEADPTSDFRPQRPGPGRLQFSPITERQLECLAWVQEGKSASDIGGILGISARTVEGHLLKACDRLGVRTRLQAVLKLRELGLIGPPPP